MFDNFNVNLRKNKGFLTYIPYILIPEYGQSNAPLGRRFDSNLELWIVLNHLLFQSLPSNHQVTQVHLAPYRPSCHLIG